MADAFSRCVFDEHSTATFPVQAIAAMHEPQQYEVVRELVRISWPYLRELVRIFIRSCPCCQKMSYIKIPINARRFTTTAAGPMEVRAEH